MAYVIYLSSVDLQLVDYVSCATTCIQGISGQLWLTDRPQKQISSSVKAEKWTFGNNTGQNC